MAVCASVVFLGGVNTCTHKHAVESHNTPFHSGAIFFPHAKSFSHYFYRASIYSADAADINHKQNLNKAKHTSSEQRGTSIIIIGRV